MARKSTEVRRREITRGLREAMAEHGYAGASIKRIAEAAGVTPGLIHYHFDNKRAILLELLDSLLEPQLERLRDLADGAGTTTEALRAVIDSLLATGDSTDPEAVAVWVTIGAEAIRDPEIGEAYAAGLDRIGTVFEELVDRGIEDGEFVPGDITSEAAAAALLATIEGYFTLAATNRDVIPRGTAADATRRMARGLLGISGES